ncbi:MAG: hypothetical protein H3C47_10440 [Candidatus Cloacimonetes bacterium]|nr:hypothetical protein [Candidatus Cloacimonadota bacterium]
MILKCPKCDRQYELDQELNGKFFRCICKALLQVPKVMGATEALQIPEVSSIAEVPEGMIFPNLTQLLDLSRWTVAEEAPPELPSLDDELPSLDLPEFDDDTDSIEDNLMEESKELGKVEEEELTDAQQESLQAVKLVDEFAMDPRLKPALDEFAQSQDQQFIVDVLYYLLEVKDPYIRPFVEKHINNTNPIAAYFSKRILADLDYIASPQQKKKALIPYNRQALLGPLFNGTETVRIQLMEKAVAEGAFGAAPYFMLRLLIEKDAFVKCKILPNLGLIGSSIETPFLGRFLDEMGPKVRVACVESLACIGGESVIPYMVKGMVDKDNSVVIAIKNSLKNADPADLAQYIFDYLLQNNVQEKRGYISILSDLKNSNAFRALVWMYEDTVVRNYAFESSKTFELSDELKADILAEYLDLSYCEEPFQITVVEYMETLDPSFSRMKLTPVNTFDDSYVNLIRDSPLFAKDFLPVDDGSEKVIEIKAVVPQSYNVINWLKEEIQKSKRLMSRVSLHTKTQAFALAATTEVIFLAFACVLGLSLILKGHGNSPKAIPVHLMPNSFQTGTGYSILTNSEFLSLWSQSLAAGLMALIPSLILGLILALEQIRRQNFKLRYLPLFPLLISPILLSFLLTQINTFTSYNIPFLTYALIQGFCMTGISYFIILRACALVPSSWSIITQSLGADSDDALVYSYSPIIQISMIHSSLLCLVFLGCSLFLGYTGRPDMDAGAWILSRLLYPDGWLMAGAIGAVLAILLAFPLLMAEFLLPLYSLIPSKNFRAEVYQKQLQISLEIWGLLFGRGKARFSSKALTSKQKKIEPEVSAEAA